ncbi:flagellar basal body P-ring protein FlgI [Candidatus Manganitrophus noduliformans]|uniref:Flagellar P-ring protein n=1 Tax=Candidatus Manganitrophus noduliformans TaxID=2606439 RepID=A0A7X6ID07_9BACT|nr:flagellar basal body P-ring protein FlgI [Candidatus Manganitrophus noduliformans]NKE73090.1 flagellar basal body P-ring protein FlgI [Candidatus Manganitrophus noduliformans]
MRSEDRKRIQKGLVLLVGIFFFVLPIDAEAVRIKDIAAVEGVRENSLIGYGLVIGLNGTGDKTGTTFTVQTLSSMLKKMGIAVEPSAVKVKNVAAVMVTAKLPPFVKTGSRIDVVVSSLGDATSLQGGTLLLTPLKGADQQVYAVAQGPISIGGFIGGKEGDSVQKNHPTAGRVAEGAQVEKEVGFAFLNKERFNLLLRQQDFTTALRISQAINAQLGGEAVATAVDSGTITLQVPDFYKGRLVELLAAIESLEVAVDLPARVVVNERTGTIVMGDQVRISEVAVSHGNLTIRVKTDFQVSQPPPFAPEGSETVVVPQRQTEVREEDAQILMLRGATIGEVVRGLNAIGVTPRDLIAILQAIKAAGALQAELEIL